MSEYHEPVETLSNAVRDIHRALISLKEEIEAIDWYNQRVDATKDAELKSILAHNRDEEKEHAAMVLEWIRRHDPAFDAHLRQYLFTTEPITERPEPSAEKSGPVAKAEKGGRRWNG